MTHTIFISLCIFLRRLFKNFDREKNEIVLIILYTFVCYKQSYDFTYLSQYQTKHDTRTTKYLSRCSRKYNLTRKECTNNSRHYESQLEKEIYVCFIIFLHGYPQHDYIYYPYHNVVFMLLVKRKVSNQSLLDNIFVVVLLW